MILAVIDGFSQDGETEYKGGVSYLVEVVNIGRTTVKENLNKLEQSGLISRTYETVNGVDFPRMVANRPPRSESGQPPGRNPANPRSESGHKNTKGKSIKGNTIKKPSKKDFAQGDDLKSFREIVAPGLPDWFACEELAQKWLEWLEFRKAAKFKSYSPIGQRKAMSNLFNISNGDPSAAIAIIEQSMAQNYQGLFAIKTKNTNGNEKRQQYQPSGDLQRRIMQKVSGEYH